MNINFEGYNFEIQQTSKGPHLVCITSEKKLEGVIISRKASWYEAEVVEHTFFTRELYDTIDGKNPQNAYLTDIIKGQMALIGVKYMSEEEVQQKAMAEHHKYEYGIFKNIIADILQSIGGYEFLQSMIRYLENDKITPFINRAINELEA